MPAATTNKDRAEAGITAFTLFDTALGRCAIAWRGGLVVGAALPEASERALRARMARRFPGAVEMIASGPAADAAAAVVRLFAGEAVELGAVAVAPDVGPFEAAVLAAARRIPTGETRTYGEIAREVGSPGAARAVGRALGANPIPILIPCHRVLGADGKSGGFSAPGGAATKMRMLEIERAARGNAPMLFDHLPWRLKG
jgi:methylated-DNA-[protein]-cysteine S-methyltransferase